MPLNKALMSKWLWRDTIGHDSFCRELIVGKYGKMILGLKIKIKKKPNIIFFNIRGNDIKLALSHESWLQKISFSPLVSPPQTPGWSSKESSSYIIVLSSS